MATTSIALIIVAIAVIAAIAFVALRGRLDPVAVAVIAPGTDDDPALSASGEAMIVGDVMPIDSNEPGMPPGTTSPPRAEAVAPRRPAQVYEPRREPKPPPEPEIRPDIRWAKRFEPRDGAFDDATRLSLIRDLGIVRAPWGVPLLTQAYEEEPALEHRRTALRALAAYRHPDTQPTFELALRADDEESRAIAANALTALSIRAALPS